MEAKHIMAKSGFTLKLFAVTGFLSIVLGVLRLVRHSSSFDIIADFALGFICLLFVWLLANKQRTV
jgi:hypothetical protein